MGKPQRFLFDVSFDRLDPPESDDTSVLPEPRFTQAELDAARSEGLAAGRSSALAEAAQSNEAKLTGAVETLTAAAERLLAERTRIESEVEHTAVAFVRAVIQRAVPALAAKDPLAELESFVTRILGETFEEPRIVLRVGDALFEPLKDRLPALSQSAGFSGKLVLLADPDLAAGDARIEWADGGAERDHGRFMAELDRILARPVPAPAPALATEHEFEETTHE
ncbi:MAG TPA: FliH/SctL family protein [Stellaceae bacterium]|nr:FliH/SctL family protein [Stellaceae bacterium]